MRKPTNNQLAPHEGEFLFYTAPDGKLQLEIFFADETVWLTQDKMAALFNRSKKTISEHIGNLFDEGELDKSAVIRNFRTTAADGKQYDTNYYNLDVIISVGYRVKSLEGTQFRKWATVTLRDFLIKGFAMDDERLKNGTHFGKDYFDELLERVREIRLSERRIYLKLADIFALASDYDKTNELTKEFFAFIQNKLHYAVAGGTAAEIVHDRSSSAKPHMGLTNWKFAPDGKVLRTDVTVAKNYLTEAELHHLRLAVSAFLDTAELRASRRLPITMAQWLSIMDGYLELNDYPKLKHAGKISKAQADAKAIQEYSEFRTQQDLEYVGDFEQAISQQSKSKKPRG